MKCGPLGVTNTAGGAVGLAWKVQEAPSIRLSSRINQNVLHTLGRMKADPPCRKRIVSRPRKVMINYNYKKIFFFEYFCLKKWSRSALCYVILPFNRENRHLARSMIRQEDCAPALISTKLPSNL
jgi:hypothetical protein